jgi:hypothetical protein
MELERIIEILEKHQAWRRDQNVPPKTEMQSPIEIGTAIDYALSELKKLRLGSISNFNFEDFAKAILRYDYNELISGKVAVCEKDSNSIIVCYDTKEECYNWVLQNYSY